MKIIQLTEKSRVVQNIKYNRGQMLVDGKWVTLYKTPAKVRPLPHGVVLVNLSM